MRRLLLCLALPFAVLASLSLFTTVASADVAPEPKCKCSTLGAPTEGGLVAAALGGSGLLLLAGRRRRR